MKEGVKNTTTSMILCFTILAYLFFVYYDKRKKCMNIRSKEESWYVGLYSIGVAFMIPFIWLPGDDVLPRLLLYYSFAAPLVYVYIGNHIYNKVMRFIYYSLVIALYIYLPFFGDNSRIVDYSLSI